MYLSSKMSWDRCFWGPWKTKETNLKTTTTKMLRLQSLFDFKKISNQFSVKFRKPWTPGIYNSGILVQEEANQVWKTTAIFCGFVTCLGVLIFAVIGHNKIKQSESNCGLLSIRLWYSVCKGKVNWFDNNDSLPLHRKNSL